MLNKVNSNVSANNENKRKKQLKDALLRGKSVEVTQQGDIKPASEIRPEDGLTTSLKPGDKFASSFYWYDNNPELYKAEFEAMENFHPDFKLTKLNDGRLAWVGNIYPRYVRSDAVWTLQLVYDHNHPSNSNYGGSIKVYSISPDLTEISKTLRKKTGEGIPHTLRDANGEIYICTARKEDVQVGEYVTSAVTALAWATKWIAVFEMWMSGDVTTRQFGSHKF